MIKMSEMHNLACDFNFMVKVKGAREISRQAGQGGLSGNIVDIPNWEKRLGQNNHTRRSRHA